MDGWWDELDTQILDALKTNEPMDPGELATRLGISRDAVCSCLAMLSMGGRVRIRSVELAAGARSGLLAA
jgi:predicted ArsR family transcriptional regulator